MTKALPRMSGCHRLGLLHETGHVWPLDTTFSTEKLWTAHHCGQSGHWTKAWKVTCRRCVPLLVPDCQVGCRGDHSPPTELMWWGGEGCASLYFLTFSGMPNIFTFVLGQRVLRMQQSVQHIVEELLKDLPSANQMWEMEIVAQAFDKEQTTWPKTPPVSLQIMSLFNSWDTNLSVLQNIFYSQGTNR